MTFDYKEWYQRPEVIARRKALSKRPENRAKRKAYYEIHKKLRPGTPFYKQYGITMTEMGSIMGVSKEAIRKRFIVLNRKMDID